MSLNKSINSKKEHRKPYRRIAERVDKTCRCHGGCPWCLGNRIHRYKKSEAKMEYGEKFID